MPSPVATDWSSGHTRGRDSAGSSQDGVPEHLKCVVCLGEGKYPACCSSRGKLVVSESVSPNLNSKP